MGEYMKKDKNKDLNIIKQAAKIYKENLLNKNIMFVYLKNNKIEFYTVTFLEEHFKHLTGVKTKLDAYTFFYKASNNRLRINDFDYKDNTTALKLNNLVKAMMINSYAKMIGEFNHNRTYLSVDKMIGNNNLIIGYDSGEKINYPKTILKGDIREYINQKPCRIIGIMRKKISDKRYGEIMYLGKNIKLEDIWKNEE